MADLNKLLEQLQPDEEKFYLLQGRDLITEDNITVLQNDNNSQKISIILPTILGGFEIDNNFHVYIDYIDGAGKPGMVACKTELTIFDDTGEKTQISGITDYSDLTSSAITDLEGNINEGSFTYNSAQYTYKTNISNIKGNPSNYQSNVKNENYEDSVDISPDYPSEYSRDLYFIKANEDNTLVITKYPQSEEVPAYCRIDWIPDKIVTAAAGSVQFSLRLERDAGAALTHPNFYWQSNPTTFTVKSNLKENFYLKKEVEENFVIQNREIKPVGDFKNVLVKGDTNSNKLFYKMNRYFQGQDMLAKKVWKNNDVFHDIYKNKYGIYFYETEVENSNVYYGLKIDYEISDIKAYDGVGNVGQYDTSTQRLTLNDETIIIHSLRKVSHPSEKKYRYELIYTRIGVGLYQTAHFDNLTAELFGFTIIFEAIGVGYISDESISTIKDNLLPVFNRQIRFVFVSSDNSYGDWNNAELEYISEEENYFIFSWTPDARATRISGDLNYYIEFFINGSYEEVEEETGRTQIRTKSYSWSTLPSTIRVEDNKVGTVNVNYIPH